MIEIMNHIIINEDDLSQPISNIIESFEELKILNKKLIDILNKKELIIDKELDSILSSIKQLTSNKPEENIKYECEYKEHCTYCNTELSNKMMLLIIV